MAVKYPDILESNNPQEYGIVPAKQVAGHKTVNTLNDLYSIADAILSLSKINTSNDAIGQLWYVISEGKYYQLIDWNNRKNSSGWEENNTTSLQKITHSELISLVNNNKLIPGQSYRIIDYQCTTSQTNTSSAGHQFDIIVIALSENILSENAKAIQHENDAYFANSDLKSWELKYCLNNDTNRFEWAVPSGKGIIYYMKDEHENECPYDFKNILYKNQYTFNYINGNSSYDGSTHESVTQCYKNSISSYRKRNKYSLNKNVFINTSFSDQCAMNILGAQCVENTFGRNCLHNVLGDSCSSNAFGNYCSHNKLGNFCTNNIIKEYCDFNTLGNNCYSNEINNYSYSNKLSDFCYQNTFNPTCHSNILGINCRENNLDSNCKFNNFGSDCHHINLTSECISNNIANSCSYIQATNVHYSTFTYSKINIDVTNVSNVYIGQNSKGRIRVFNIADLLALEVKLIDGVLHIEGDAELKDGTIYIYEEVSKDVLSFVHSDEDPTIIEEILQLDGSSGVVNSTLLAKGNVTNGILIL